ncbi:MAG TPA: 4-hydroxythreonine-4-phosphate dehydrogenase PdxA [Chloroflexi bacterium]|jgi:4-hydroxythreonine-4-phosphate dehydrogenase|nr:4-hydroxythreonine-4-phosphate dehydrogenase PdxA [Chloroflexota bacterium]
MTTQPSRRPIMGVTMGDASGAGPEIITKAWADPAVREIARLVVIGDAACMAQAMRITGVSGTIRAVERVADAFYSADALDVLDLKNIDMERLEYGKVQAMSGKAAYEAVVRAVELAMANEIDAVVTSALNKEALNLAGYHYDGHTELLKELTNAQSVTMMLTAGQFRVTHVSTHCSLRQAIERTRKERILEVIHLTVQALQQMGIAKPRLAVAGLNPHAGEGGLFGDEEVREIQPAIDAAIAEGIDVYPIPLPPDTVFYRMSSAGQFDAVVAMYHDQGHIPTKVLGFAEGVNVTLGLPIIRTSVDHGTVFGKAGKGTADETSLKRAIEVAVSMCSGRS